MWTPHLTTKSLSAETKLLKKLNGNVVYKKYDIRNNSFDKLNSTVEVSKKRKQSANLKTGKKKYPMETQKKISV